MLKTLVIGAASIVGALLLVYALNGMSRTVSQGGDLAAAQQVPPAPRDTAASQLPPKPETPPSTAQQSPPAPQEPNAPPQHAVPPQRTETITYDSWTVACQSPVDKPSQKQCVGSLQVIEQQPQRRVVMVWLIGRNKSGVLQSVIQTPTGVLIEPGVVLKLGGTAPRKLSYIACGAQQCEAAIDMDRVMVSDAVASTSAVITLHVPDGRDVNFTVPIKGIDKVLASLAS